MSGLEDRLLKQNIPGKYTWWDDEYTNEGNRPHQDPSDNDDNDGHEDEHDSGHGSAGLPMAAMPSASNGAAPSRPSSRKPGVKGVLEDYKLDQEEKRRQRLIDRLEKEEILERNTIGVLMKPGEVSNSWSAVQARQQQARRQRERYGESNDDDDDDDDDKDYGNDNDLNNDDNNGFMARYRAQRIREMQQQQLQQQQPLPLPSFGDKGVEEVDPVGYATAVDETDPRVYVVVHLYETYVPACRTLIHTFEELSRKSFPHVRFLSLRASSASSKLDPVALPSVLIHKGGELLHNLTPFTATAGEKLSFDDVRAVLDELLVGCGGGGEKDGRGGVVGQKDALSSKTLQHTAGFSSNIDPTDSDDELDEFCEGFSPSIEEQ